MLCLQMCWLAYSRKLPGKVKLSARARKRKLAPKKPRWEVLKMEGGEVNSLGSSHQASQFQKGGLIVQIHNVYPTSVRLWIS